MNNSRRKELQILLEKVEDNKSDLETIKSEEEEYFENIPENLQSSERYDLSERSIVSMEDALSSLEDATNSIDEILNE